VAYQEKSSMRHGSRIVASEYLADRRQFILSGASLAVLPWLGNIACGAMRRNPAFPANPFQLGVASGDPAPDGMVLWTRLAPDPLEGGGMPTETFEVSWEVARDDAMRDVVRKGVALATPQLGHSVHVELTGLAPDRWYWYRFSVGDAQSPVGRTRTMPQRQEMPERLRFAFASCQHYETGLFTAYQHMAAEELDLVVHLGDYIYEMAGQDKRIRKHAGPEITTLEEYRNRYAQYRSDPHLQAAHAQFPWLVVWDDHEFDNNCAGCISEELKVSPEEFLLRRANAYQAYYEHMPLRRRCLPRGPDMQLYRRATFGRLAQFEMLDTRQYRTDQPNGDGKKPLMGDVLNPQATLLGERQERWLMRGLLESTSRWNILAQQVMMARVNLASSDSPLFSMDQWPGYDVARTRLLSFLADRRVSNPVVLTGDIHSNWVNDLKVHFDEENDPAVATEFVGTSISSGGNGVAAPKGQAALLSENPFVRFHNAERGYVRCVVTPSEWRSDFQVVEYVERPGSPLITRKSFVVENGKPGAVQA
jgi:alkaline phosphatase D